MVLPEYHAVYMTARTQNRRRIIFAHRITELMDQKTDIFFSYGRRFPSCHRLAQPGKTGFACYRRMVTNEYVKL
jgi:hypothetical protein